MSETVRKSAGIESSIPLHMEKKNSPSPNLVRNLGVTYLAVRDRKRSQTERVTVAEAAEVGSTMTDR